MDQAKQQQLRMQSHHRKVKERLGGVTAPVRVNKICIYRSADAFSPKQSFELGLGMMRDYYACSHPDHPNKQVVPSGEYVCSCKGCNRRCSGFVASSNLEQK
jgi:hypothetical protein